MIFAKLLRFFPKGKNLAAPWAGISIVLMLFLPVFIFAQENLDETCRLLIEPNGCQGMSSVDCHKALENCAQYYEEQSEQISQDISKTEKEKKTLQSQISTLKKKVEGLSYQIQQGNVMIKDLSLQIGDTQSSIDKISLKIEESKGQLASIIRTIYEEDQKSITEILFEGNISNFFDNLVYMESLNAGVQSILDDTKKLKQYLGNQKEKMDEEKEDLGKLLKIQNLQKQESDKTKKEQEYYLTLKEAEYQKLLEEKKEIEKRAAEIMARITQLTLPGLEVPKSKKELYELASWAGKLTGVRPALILGVIEVESALGVNVGQCNCAGQPYCKYSNISYKQVMSSKQWDAFLKITKELGLDPNTTPVSCAVSGGMVQMGGAMGPAQFMPNTWLNLRYKAKVEERTGVVPANPWRARDAFLAAGLYLADWKANTQIKTNEIGAVTAYLCGTNIMTATCQRAGGVWYKNSVMEKTDKWQGWINQGILD